MKLRICFEKLFLLFVVLFIFGCNSGNSNDSGSVKTLPKIAWKLNFEGQGINPPAMGSDGSIVITVGGSVHVVDPDGKVKWTHLIEKGVNLFAPVIGKNGAILVSSDRYLYCLKPDGNLEWKYGPGHLLAPPSIGIDGTIYLADLYRFLALNTDGTIKWIHDDVSYLSVIGPDGTIYTGKSALNPDGTKKFDLPVQVQSPVVMAFGIDGAIYAGTGAWDGTLYALSPEGAVKWTWTYEKSHPRAFKDILSITTDTDGTIYAISGNWDINAISPDGVRKWGKPIDPYVTSSVAIDSSGFIYLPLSSGLELMDPEGSTLWTKEWDDPSLSALVKGSSSPVITSNGKIYVSIGNTLYAYETESKGLRKSPWPRVYGNNENSGNNAPAIKDTDSPSIPDGINISSSAFNMAELTWPVSTDRTSYVTGYKIFRNGEYLGCKGRGFTDSGLLPSTLYTYRISAVDAAGNESEKSAEVFIRIEDKAMEGSLKWKYRAEGQGYDSDLSPAISADGTVIHPGIQRDGIYALNPEGTLKGKINGYYGASSIAKDGTIYSRSNGSLDAFSPDGILKWKYEDAKYLTDGDPASICSDGKILVNSQSLLVFGDDGSFKWKFSPDADEPLSSTVILPDGSFYSFAYTGSIFKLNSEGILIWKHNAGVKIKSEPAVDSEGVVYFGSDEGFIHALKPDGSLKWSYKTGSEVSSSPVIASDGTVYFGSYDYFFYALNRNGELKWKYKTGDSIPSSPAIGSDGIIYTGSYDGFLYAFNPDGTVRWKYQYGADDFISPSSSPAIADDGTLYFASRKYFYAIQTSSMGLATGGWPKIYHDNQNTGRLP